MPLIDDGPQRLDWRIARTADLAMSLLAFDDDTGAPEDMSGSTFAAVVDGGSGLTLTAAGTTTSIEISAAAAANTIAKGKWAWGLWRLTPVREPIAEGELEVVANIVPVAP